MNDMRPYPMPMNDTSRSRIIDALNLDRRRSDPFFDHVTSLVREIFDVPASFISLIGADEQIFLAKQGFDFDATPRNMSLCAFTVAKKKTIAIPDTHLDPRSLDHPIVVKAPNVRCSISAPVILSSGFCVGSVCAVDLVPRDPPGEAQIAMLEHLASMVARFYEMPLEPDPVHAKNLRHIARDAQEEFLSLISHELRTPLNGIVGLSEFLEPADDDQREILESITSSARHLDDIIQNILTFTDLGSGDIELQETPVDLARIARRVCESTAKLARLHGKSLHMDAFDGSARVNADASKLELALMCLVSNFVAHGGQRAALSVARSDDGGLLLQVTDDGGGILPEREAAIWHAFEIGANLNDRKADGIGLGLPLTNRIVELHGGELDMINVPGHMAARIRLPAYRTV